MRRTPSNIRKTIEDLYDVDLSEKNKEEPLVFMRWCYFYFSRLCTKRSLNSIGEEVGYDHATVYYGIQKIKNEMKYNLPLLRIFKEVNEKIRVYDVNDKISDFKLNEDVLKEYQDTILSLKKRLQKSHLKVFRLRLRAKKNQKKYNSLMASLSHYKKKCS